MPPKPRKRVKKAARRAESDSDIDRNRSPNPSSRRVGFLALPPEVLSKIASHFPKIHVNDILSNPIYIGGYIGAPNYRTRFYVLRALSQTCHHLREFYLPLLWERFEACLIPNPNGHWFRYMADALERKSIGMLEYAVLAPFAKLLGRLSNVHTLQIPHTHPTISTALKNAFEDCSFPSIRTVIIPNCAHEILRCCPQVESITCNEDDGCKLASALAAVGCSKLQVARGISLGPTHLKRFMKANPPLKLVRVKADEEAIRAFGHFPSLRIIEIECLEDHPQANLMELVEIAKEVLRTCAAYAPPPKPRRGRNAQDTTENPADLYTDPRTVRVRYYLSGRFRRNDVSWHTAVLWVPLKIDIFPV